MHFNPASITVQRELSIMMGTRAMSGSAATRFRKRVIAASESRSPSSMLTSMICAPPSTWSRATLSASSYCPARMNLANFGEPVTFVRSPMFTKLRSGRNVSGSRPLSRRYGSGRGIVRGWSGRTASAIARMCSGVVPQHPPTMFSQPLAAKSRNTSEVSAAVSSYPPKAFGRPALG